MSGSFRWFDHSFSRIESRVQSFLSYQFSPLRYEVLLLDSFTDLMVALWALSKAISKEKLSALHSEESREETGAGLLFQGLPHHSHPSPLMSEIDSC